MMPTTDQLEPRCQHLLFFVVTLPSSLSFPCTVHSTRGHGELGLRNPIYPYHDISFCAEISLASSQSQHWCSTSTQPPFLVCITNAKIACSWSVSTCRSQCCQVYGFCLFLSRSRTLCRCRRGVHSRCVHVFRQTHRSCPCVASSVASRTWRAEEPSSRKCACW